MNGHKGNICLTKTKTSLLKLLFKYNVTNYELYKLIASIRIRKTE